MRSSTSLWVGLVLLVTVRGFGQETFAPLITDNTVAFVHIDLHQVGIDKIKSHVEKMGGELLKQLQFDDKSFKATTRELQTELNKLDALVRPPYETITEKLDVRELALIADADLMDNEIVAVLAAPWKNKTPDDLKVLQEFFHSQLKWDFPILLIPSGDFLFIPVSNPDNEIVKLAFAAWLSNLVPSKDSPIHQGLQALGKDEIKIVVVLNEKLKTIIFSELLDDNIPKEIQNMISFAVQKIEWAATSFSISAVFSSNEKTNDTLLLVKTAKRIDAVQLRSLMENAIEIGINAARYGVEQNNNQGFQIPPLFYEFMKGFLRTLLPDIEGDKLVFRSKGEILPQQAAAAYSGMAAVLLLPAVQAARESARRMQCMNSLKQIVLAIHNYHDSYKGFPPLYTVDKDGKALHSWRVLILPFIEQSALYQQIRLDEPWDSEHNKQFHNVVLHAYSCPSNPNGKTAGSSCCYSAIAGEGLIPAKKAGDKTSGDFSRIADGTSNTLAVVEVKQPFCWMDPTADVTLDELLEGVNTKNGRVGSFHAGGFNAALFDGSVRFLQNSISKEILKALGTCAGSER
jgi:prepilin-type processing-associated H-X9-DG protein